MIITQPLKDIIIDKYLCLLYIGMLQLSWLIDT